MHPLGSAIGKHPLTPKIWLKSQLKNVIKVSGYSAGLEMLHSYPRTILALALPLTKSCVLNKFFAV